MKGTQQRTTRNSQMENPGLMKVPDKA